MATVGTAVLPRKNGAFTLIELLIVVAIIAILAAIAVPNFLEAQTRARVSRVRTDMRSVATALELYRVDNLRYPPASDDDGRPVTDPAAGDGEWYESRVAIALTTPVAYIATRPPDIFAPRQAGALQILHYCSADYQGAAQASAAGTLFSSLYQELKGEAPPQKLLFCLLSYGPDGDHDVAEGDAHDHDHDHGHSHGEPAIYDPTNGTVSNGDIHYMGPAPGFL